MMEQVQIIISLPNSYEKQAVEKCVDISGVNAEVRKKLVRAPEYMAFICYQLHESMEK